MLHCRDTQQCGPWRSSGTTWAKRPHYSPSVGSSPTPLYNGLSCRRFSTWSRLQFYVYSLSGYAFYSSRPQAKCPIIQPVYCRMAPFSTSSSLLQVRLRNSSSAPSIYPLRYPPPTFLTRPSTARCLSSNPTASELSHRY